MIGTALRGIFTLPDLRKRVLITFALLAVSRIGFWITVPGVNYDVIEEIAGRQAGTWIDFIGIVTGGRLTNASIFSLGVMPYISASIIFTMLVKLVPSLERLQKEGPQGYRKIQQYERYATVLICIIQSSFIVAWMTSVTAGNERLVPNATFSFRLMAIVSMTAGTVFLMWLGEQITEFGIGNGISLLIMNGIVARMPGKFSMFISNIARAVRQGVNPAKEVTELAIFVLLFVGIVAFVVLITQGQRRIPVQQQKQTRGRRVYGGMRYYLPLRVNQGGVMPIIFAQAILMLPIAIISSIPGLQSIRFWFNYGTFWYIFAYVLLILFFEYFWTALVFNPIEMANQLQEHGNFIPGIRPGRRTAEMLEYILNRVALAGGTFVAFIAIVPQIVSSLMGYDIFLATILGGTGILIVVGVALEFVQRVEAQLLAREYEGFMRKPMRGR
ncbi:MAG: preprotein translocase subunit SecY [Planctomycetota bacterium]|nr:MAG: preprotein translocase subunit SecY [Planctomycetota bacterium]